MRLTALFILLMLLTACGAGSRPFQHADSGAGRLAAPPEGLSVLVEPVEGVRSGTAVAETMAEALRLAEVPASTETSASAGFRLFGAPDGEQVMWRLTDTGGHQVAAARTPDHTAGPRIPEPGFRAAAADLALAIRHHQTADLPGGTPAPGPLQLYLANAIGAPGDGHRALPLAMRSALSEYSFELVETASPEIFNLQPLVRLGPVSGDAQLIEIVWILSLGGHEVGRLAQRNAVPPGSLEKSWGATAALAARAAAPGVSELIAEALR